MEGDDPMPMFTDKHNDHDVATRVMMQYGTTRGARNLNVALISDPTLWFNTQLLESKFLHGNRHNEVSVGAIRVAEKCAMGVTMSWAHFLVKEFHQDYLEAQ